MSWIKIKRNLRQKSKKRILKLWLKWNWILDSKDYSRERVIRKL